MYNRTEKQLLKSTYSAVGEGRFLFNRNIKPGIFRLGMAPKKNFLIYSNHFVINKTCNWKRGHGRH